MIRLLADENIVGLGHLPSSEVEVRTVPGRKISARDLIGIDALWVRSVTRVDAALLQDSNLRFVGTATAGTEHIDERILRQRQIAFAAAPGANANAVVEYVLSALAFLEAPWEALESGARLGVVGYGHVGRRLVSFARQMGWSVCVSDPWVEAGQGVHRDQLDRWEQQLFTPLERVLNSTVISLHCSLLHRDPFPSYHLLGRRQLEQLSREQWLVNASRGEVIDSHALLEHLRSGRSAQCVLDVWENEPAIDPRLFDFPSLRLATPHIAGYSWDAKWNATGVLWGAMRASGLVRQTLAAEGEDPLTPLRLSGTGPQMPGTLFTQRYRIADDDAALRATVVLDLPQRAEAFDALRRNYPMRRELRGSTVNSPQSAGASDVPRRLLFALGVAVQQ